MPYSLRNAPLRPLHTTYTSSFSLAEIPSASAGASAVDLAFIDAMWADPQDYPGSSQNPRGPGLSAFGPDVTERSLQETGLALVVRSHQVPANNDGFYVHHNRASKRGKGLRASVGWRLGIRVKSW